MTKKIFLGALLLRLGLMLISQSHPDIYNHLDWGARLLQLGPAKFYENTIWGVSWPNQPFGSIYLFGFVKIVRDLIFNSIFYVNVHVPTFPSKIIPILEANLQIWLVKLPFIISDIGIGTLIYFILKEKKKPFALLGASLFLFNPAVIYNSAIWGQTDSLINFLALLGLWFFYRQHYFAGIFFFIFSLTFKMSLLIYSPLLLLLIWQHRASYLKIGLSLTVSSTIILLLARPFSIFPSTLRWLYYQYSYLVFSRQGDMLNGNAFNFWLILFGEDLSRKQTLLFLFTSAKNFGYLLGGTFISLIFLPLLAAKKTLPQLLQVLFLIGFTAFMFFTNMHERYLYPILPIFSLLVVLEPKYFKYRDLVIVSLIHLLNLYTLWYYPLIPILKNFLEFSNYLPAKLMSIILLVYYFKYLYAYFKNIHQG